MTFAFRPASRRLLATLAVAYLLSISAVMAVPGVARGWDALAFDAESETQLVTLHNQARAAAGLPALKVDAELRDVARWRSRDMIERNYFSHTILGTTEKVFAELGRRGYCYKVAGENIGWNTYPDDTATAAIHEMFMGSSGHRANILGTGWDVIGIGAYKGADGKKMWTVLFADKCAAATPAPTATPKPTAKPTAQPTAQPTPKPVATPRPTPRPTPAASIAPTDAPAASPVASVAPASPSATASPTPRPTARPTARPVPTPTPTPGLPAGVSTFRVVDGTTTTGLVDSIVVDVAASFFGG